MIKQLYLTDLNEAIQTQVSDLFKQLAPDIKQLSLKEVLDKKNNCSVLCYEENGRIVGLAVMCSYKVMSGYNGWIEDVIVDENYRGKGIGRKLIEKLIEIGKDLYLTNIFLFTGKHRTAANKLYSNLGFTKKNSNIYSLKISTYNEGF